MSAHVIVRCDTEECDSTAPAFLLQTSRGQLRAEPPPGWSEAGTRMTPAGISVAAHACKSCTTKKAEVPTATAPAVPPR